jgi:hypothetical protein
LFLFGPIGRSGPWIRSKETRQGYKNPGAISPDSRRAQQLGRRAASAGRIWTAEPVVLDPLPLGDEPVAPPPGFPAPLEA